MSSFACDADTWIAAGSIASSGGTGSIGADDASVNAYTDPN